MVTRPVTAREREMCAVVVDPGGAHGAPPYGPKVFLISCSSFGEHLVNLYAGAPSYEESAPDVATYTPVLEFFFLPSWYIITQSSLLNYFN